MRNMDVRVVLVEPKRWENVGAVARVMKNFGFFSLYIVLPDSHLASYNADFHVKSSAPASYSHPQQHQQNQQKQQQSQHISHQHISQCISFQSQESQHRAHRALIDEKAFYVASHAEDVLERCKIVDTIEDAIADAHVVVGTTAKTGSDMNILRNPYIEPEELGKFAMRKEGKLCVLFGREDIGLLNEELKKCDFILHIPTHHEQPVMNLSHAVAVVLYELHKARRRYHRHGNSSESSTSAMYSARSEACVTRIASVEEKERLLAHFRTLLEQVERREHRRERTLLVLRHVFGRAGITSREVRTIHGMLRKTLRALQQERQKRQKRDELLGQRRH